MRPFSYINATTTKEASDAIKKGGAVAIAGGGDLIGALKDNIFPEYPRTVVNLKSIPGMDSIEADGGALRIGALATLADIARSPTVRETAPALAAAAELAASPALRETSTIGGNLCQLPRCWYFRKLNNRFCCARKGGERCFAPNGDNRYHSIFGGAAFEISTGVKGICFAVNQGDIAPVLTAMDARLITTERSVDIREFFAVGVMSSTALGVGELLTEIRIPLSDFAEKCRYRRFAFRKSIDFPVINLAVACDRENNYRIALGGVAPAPYVADKAEALLKGRAMTPELAEEAGLAAAGGSRALEQNAYKAQLIKTLVKRELAQLAISFVSAAR